MTSSRRYRCALVVCLVGVTAGCRFFNSLLSLSFAEVQNDAIDAAARNSPNERIQSQAEAARRDVYDASNE
jgi:hypothetical protein